MATQTDTTTDTTDPSAGESPQASSGILGKLKLAGIVLAVIVTECAIAYALLPDAERTAAMLAVKNASQTEQAEEEEDAGESALDSEQTKEISLDKFAISAYQPLSTTTLRIDFHLVVVIEADQDEEFQKRLAEKSHRIREKVLVTVRSATINDLADPELDLVKRKLLEEINKLLGKPFIKRIIFSDFRFIEQ